MDAQEREAFSPDEFAKLVGVGRTTVFGEIKAGRLVAKKVGKRTIITCAEGRRWLAALPRVRDAAVEPAA
jgi:hypothetical protein